MGEEDNSQKNGIITHMRNIFHLKKQIVPLLRKYRIKKASLFGSYVRGEERKRSDIDILVEPPEHMSLLDLAGLQIDLEKKIKKKFDVLTYNSIHPLLKNYVMKDQKIFYEKR